MIRENLSNAIRNNDQTAIVKQIEVQKELINCFKLFTKCFAVVMVNMYLTNGIAMGLEGFEIISVRFLILKCCKTTFCVLLSQAISEESLETRYT